MTGVACVYRAFDLGGTLLYVGSSVDPRQRYRDHESRAPWWPFKVDIREEWFATITEARAAELVAIATEHPRWNVRGRDNAAHPDGTISAAYGRFSSPHLRDEIDIWREWKRVRLELTHWQDRMAEVEDRIARVAAARMSTVRASP